MSSFKRETKHPVTGKWENADWLDDAFGRHHYGVRFPGEPNKLYDPNIYEGLETRDNTEPEPVTDTSKKSECCDKCWLERVPFGSAAPCLTPGCSCHQPANTSHPEEDWETWVHTLANSKNPKDVDLLIAKISVLIAKTRAEEREAIVRRIEDELSKQFEPRTILAGLKAYLKFDTNFSRTPNHE